MNKLKSRKFWMALGTAVVCLVGAFGFDLDPEFAVSLAVVATSVYIIGEALVDALRK